MRDAMRTAQTIALSLLTSLLTAALWATPTAATVRVSFADPARFTDSNLYDANALGAIAHPPNGPARRKPRSPR